MRPRAIPGFASLVLASLLPSAPALAGGTAVVALSRDAAMRLDEDGRAEGSAALAQVLARHGVSAGRRLDRAGARRGGRTEYWSLTSGAPGFDPARLARELMQVPGVIAASPNLVLPLAIVPNDPGFPNQWPFSVSSAAIRAQNAWNHETGDSAVVIAILDHGIDRTHPDLAAKTWQNVDEIEGNALDDDGNGFVDDRHGWDFGDDDADPNPELFIPPTVGIDIGYHGTFAAGLAGAASNDGVGVAGTAWACKLMSLRVADTDSMGLTVEAVIEAFDYAIAEGASVISMSFGTTDPLGGPVFQALVNDAVAADIVCVAGAGNSGTDLPVWPAACDSVIAVAATNSANQRASFSNWGYWVDLAAPGELVYSTVQSNYVWDELSALIFEIYAGWDGVTPYMYESGTSFSGPIVAGAAALVRSAFPGLSAPEVATQLVLSGDVVPTYDNEIGPRLNLERAVTVNYLGVPGDSPGLELTLAPHPNPTRRGMTWLRWSVPASGRARLSVHDLAGRRIRTLFDGSTVAGPSQARWDGRDQGGREVPAGVYLARLEFGVTARIARLVVIP